MKGKNLRRVAGVVVGFLALVGVGASATHYVYEPANEGFLEYPAIVFLHVVFGSLYLAFAGFQFVGRVRSGRPGYHYWAGRALVSTGVVVGATGLFMGLVIPFSGWTERVYIGVFGTLFLVALVKGFVHIRAGRVALHREWMIRAFAVALAFATMRVIFIPALAIVDDPTDEQITTLSASSFMAAFVLHALLAEVWIRLTRRTSIPKIPASKAA